MSGKVRLTLQQKKDRDDANFKKAKKIALDVAIAIIALAALGAGVGYLSEGLQAAAAEAKYEEAKAYTVASKTHDINFAVVQANGSSATSWIYLPDTAIDYPIVQGPDNDMYLDKDAYGNPSKAGAIFINYANSREMTDPKTIIFGHNMNDGSMFTALHDYKNEEFGKTHTDAYIYMVDGSCKHYKLRYYLFTEPLDEDIYVTNKSENPAITAAKLNERADIVYEPASGNNLICLSTCTFHEYRTVVVFEYVDDKKPIAGMSEKMKNSLETEDKKETEKPVLTAEELIRK